ncbi:flagellar basal body-associated protein FliL [Roseivivax sp. THAF40]|uniref:flagellar basal body-associated FliL family protein n=1 Tax=unclassified Roseivivax TaxID=2639302 RepID=UPI00126849CE|nr:MULTISPECIES: flagellar basal body-associated FliL family protein [unclassified Roseivivax]QFS84692.1 flagellar basal body-associated protein FliL [Roseivivax sp. THAF197b]QFT48519.1 flagellar basal body-associated protein FliL [Roseivivax sp. THAF40]
MTDASIEGGEAGEGVDVAKKKSGKLPLIAGVVLAILGGAGGYYAVSSGLLFGSDEAPVSETTEKDASEIPAMYEGQTAEDIRFVQLSPLVVSLGPDAGARHLRFKAAIETIPGAEDDVMALEPRILDVMNGYLRALTPADIEAQDALFVIRAQLTRRLQLVLGEDRMLDLLVMEFVLN